MKELSAKQMFSLQLLHVSGQILVEKETWSSSSTLGYQRLCVLLTWNLLRTKAISSDHYVRALQDDDGDGKRPHSARWHLLYLWWAPLGTLVPFHTPSGPSMYAQLGAWTDTNKYTPTTIEIMIDVGRPYHD